jgi:putative ABC transport system ATP-binding protein
MIATQGLVYRYPGGSLLQFANMTVPQGTALLLRGDSGAGKSTWLALVAGLLTRHPRRDHGGRAGTERLGACSA